LRRVSQAARARRRGPRRAAPRTEDICRAAVVAVGAGVYTYM
jgi:hypothetical protein